MSIALIADEGHEDAAQAIDQEVAREQRAGAHGAVGHPLSESGISAMMISALKMMAERMALCGVAKPHDVEHAELRIEGQEHRRMMAKYLAIRWRSRRSSARRASSGAACRSRRSRSAWSDRCRGPPCCRPRGRRPSGVHGHAHIGLGERRGVVCAVARTWPPACPWPAPGGSAQACFPASPGEEEIVHARLRRDRRRRDRIVAGDHHRADAHAAQFGEALADAALDDVLQRDDGRAAARRATRPAACRRSWRSRRRWRAAP